MPQPYRAHPGVWEAHWVHTLVPVRVADRLVLMPMLILALMLMSLMPMLGQGCSQMQQAPPVRVVRVGASKAGPHGAGDGYVFMNEAGSLRGDN